jgi:hypothetical protein
MEIFKKLDKLKDMGYLDREKVVGLRANLATNKLSANIAVNVIYDLAIKNNKLEKDFKQLKKDFDKLNSHFKNQREVIKENDTQG